MMPSRRTGRILLERAVASLPPLRSSLALAITVAAAAQAAPVLQHESTLQISRESLRGARPVAVTTGADGSVCVTDAASRAGTLFDTSSIAFFRTGATAGLSDPVDLVVEASGGFVCTDGVRGGGRTLRRLDFFGHPLAYEPERPSEHWQPEHLLVLQDGGYLTTYAANGLLAKHDAATGALLWKRELQEMRSGELLALGRPAEGPDGRLFLPIPGDRQVVVLSADGRIETAFGIPGGSQGRLAFPVGIAFCPDGTIAVLDKMRHVILLYDKSYRFLSEFGTFGMGPTNLYYPAAIASTREGLIYVVQGFEGRVHVFRFTTTEAFNVRASRPWPERAGRVERPGRSQGGGGARSGDPLLAVTVSGSL
jgi:hypothetical protein